MRKPLSRSSRPEQQMPTRGPLSTISNPMRRSPMPMPMGSRSSPRSSRLSMTACRTLRRRTPMPCFATAARGQRRANDRKYRTPKSGNPASRQGIAPNISRMEGHNEHLDKSGQEFQADNLQDRDGVHPGFGDGRYGHDAGARPIQGASESRQGSAGPQPE